MQILGGVHTNDMWHLGDQYIWSADGERIQRTWSLSDSRYDESLMRLEHVSQHIASWL